jgi:PhzF family phenazine biosynthesis protein
MSSCAPFYLVDAFARTPFTGNPAGVVILREEVPAELMQKIAMEMNQAETAFVRKTDEGRWSLRWFTPATEVDLCGHATLGSAAAMWESGVAEPGRPIEFSTRSGILSCTPRGEEIELDFPATPPTACAPPDGLYAALGVAGAVFVGRSRFDLLVEVESEEIVRGLKPDFVALGRVEVRGTMVTARALGKEYDFVSRFFAPRAGIPEDPVTGSAHCCLAPYWTGKLLTGKQLTGQLGRTGLVGYQASARGGFVAVEMKEERVLLQGGYRVTVRGELLM